MPAAQTTARLAREGRSILHLATPLIAGQLASFSMAVIDTLMAGRLSAAALGAVAVGNTVWMALVLFVLGILLALPPFVSQFAGGGRPGRAGTIAWQGFWLGLVLAAGLMVAVRGVRPVLDMVGVEPALIPDVMAYLVAISWESPALCTFLVLRFFSEGLGYTRPVFYFGALAAVLNIPANWVFMYGALGVPGMGAEGCGWATTLVTWLAMAAMLLYVARQRRYRVTGLLERVVPPSMADIGALLRVGVPVGAAIFMEGTLFTGTTLLAGALGTTTVAAHQVALNFSSLAFMIPLGLSMAITVRVGQAVGRGDATGVRIAGGAGLALIAVAQVLSAAVMLVFAGTIAGLYSDDPAVRAAATTLLRIAAVFQLSDGIQVGMAGALRGLKDTFRPMLLTVVAYWGVGLPTAWVFGVHLGHGAPGLWVGLITGLTTAAVLLGWRFARSSRYPRYLSPRDHALAAEIALGDETPVEPLDPRRGP